MDDPTRRNPPDPGPAPSAANLQVHGATPIASLPGMPPVPVLTHPSYGGGVSVHVSNVVASMPYPYAAQSPQPPGWQPVAVAPPADAAPGVVEMMRQDASQKAMEAVSRRGPARVLGLTIGSVMVGVMLVLLALSMFGVPAAVIVVAEIPCLALAIGAFVLARRAGEGPGGHALEQAILRVAAQHAGVVRVVALAQETGRPLRECQVAIDAMVASGHATVDADDRGGLVYRIPDLEPPLRSLGDGGR